MTGVCECVGRAGASSVTSENTRSSAMMAVDTWRRAPFRSVPPSSTTAPQKRSASCPSSYQPCSQPLSQFTPPDTPAYVADSYTAGPRLGAVNTYLVTVNIIRRKLKLYLLRACLEMRNFALRRHSLQKGKRCKLGVRSMYRTLIGSRIRYHAVGASGNN